MNEIRLVTKFNYTYISMVDLKTFFRMPDRFKGSLYSSPETGTSEVQQRRSALHTPSC